MAHKKGHIGSANEDATTYGMPRREAISRGRQHLYLIDKAIANRDKAKKDLDAKKYIKESQRLKKLAKSGNKIGRKIQETQPKPYGSQKGYN